VWLLKLDPLMVVVVEWRYADLLVHTMMHAILVVLSIIWLLKMNATMVAMMRQQHEDLNVHALMHTFVTVVPQSRGLPQNEERNGRLSCSRDTRYWTRGPGSRADRNAKTSRHGLLAGDDGASHSCCPSS